MMNHQLHQSQTQRQPRIKPTPSSSTLSVIIVVMALASSLVGPTFGFILPTVPLLSSSHHRHRHHSNTGTYHQFTTSPQHHTTKHASLITILRGGSTTDNDSPSDDDDDDAISVTAEIVLPPSIENDKRRRRNESNRNNIPSLLWLSLACDSLLNQKKRALLIPQGPASAATVPLAMGYLLSSSVFTILSLDYFSSEEEVSSLEEWSYRNDLFWKMSVLLAAFGVCQLAGHCYASFPFLGASAAMIHGHNVLVAVNNGRMAKGDTTTTTGSNQMRGLGRALSLKNLTSSSMVYLFAAGAAVVTSIYKLVVIAKVSSTMTVAKTIAFDLFGTTVTSTPPLLWASVSRWILISGLTLFLKEASDDDRLGEVPFLILNGMISLFSAAVATTSIVNHLFSWSAGSIMNVAFHSLLSIFTGYNCLVHFRRNIEKS